MLNIMSDSKFYIYGGGKWRLVDIDNGCVEGWGKASFVYCRRGKVHTAKTKSVCAALRYLTANKKSAAKDGPRLPQKKLGMCKAYKKRTSTFRWDTDQASSRQPADIVTCNKLEPSPDPTLVRIADEATDKITCPINRTNTAEKEKDAADSNQHANKNGICPINRTNKEEKDFGEASNSNQHENTNGNTIQKSDQINTQHIKKNTRKLVDNSKKSSDTQTRKEKITQEKITQEKIRQEKIRQEKTTQEKIRQEKITQQKTRQEKTTQEKIRQEKTTQEKIRQEKITQEKTQKNKTDECKELIIDDADVDIYFKYLMKTCEEFDPLRFELDDEYKTQYFFKINPLVNVSRCPRIAKMLKQRDDISLTDFVTNLGLQSVTKSKIYTSESEVNKENTFKRNKTKETQNSISDSDDSIHKKSKKLSKLLKELNENESQESDSTDENELAGILKYLESRKRTKLTKKTSTPKSKKSEEFDSQECTEKLVYDNIQKENVSKPNEVVQSKVRKVNGKVEEKVRTAVKLNANSSHTISQRPSVASMREYTNLEDHAIVSWISVSDRAQFVNGNKIWRELEEQFERLTGKPRSFQSLRNRYLRYILPSLGLLALPPSEVARLRAAAATGSLKLTVSRRNSIFGEPTHGALSRRPGALNKSSDDDPDFKHKSLRESPKKPRLNTSPMRKSPRYSEITRNFANKHQQDSSSTNTPSHSPTRDKKTRKSPENTRKSQENVRKSQENTGKSQENARKQSNNSLNHKKSFNSPRKSPNGSRKSLETKTRTKISIESSDTDSSAFVSKSQAKRRSLRTNKKTPSKETRSRKLFNPVALL